MHDRILATPVSLIAALNVLQVVAHVVHGDVY
jgi:hypothetical protein